MDHMCANICVEEVVEKLAEKMAAVRERSAEKIPYTTVNGVHDDRSGADQIGWWTNGFWGGMMWQMYGLTGDERYMEIAAENEKKLDALFLDHRMLDHDNGFKWLPTAVANYKMTGNEASKNRGILAADNLAGRFNLRGGFIRAWNDWKDHEDRRGWAIIDCMMNLPLLYWASDVTADPRYRYVAEAHADTAMKHFPRENGSVRHIIEFNVYSGEYVRSYGGQGRERGSSWTRGQAWGIYGFVASFRHTGKLEYLQTAERIADNFISHIPESGLIPVDFDQPEEIPWIDSTAAAIAACGFLELARMEDCKKPKKYEKAAERLLYALIEDADWSPEVDHILPNCSAAYHEEKHNYNIIYGDYFFLEAIAKLAGREIYIW